MLTDLPITKADILWNDEILGPKLGSLKVKTTRKTLSRAVINTSNDLPKGLLEQNRHVTIAVYINEIPFIMTMSQAIHTSQAIHFGTAKIIKNEKAKTIINAYQGWGMTHPRIQTIWTFKIPMETASIILKFIGCDEHVLKIERWIRAMERNGTGHSEDTTLKNFQIMWLWNSKMEYT